MSDSDSPQFIGYVCGICGNKTSTSDDHLPQCQICRKPLCRNCNQHHYCPEHWRSLNPTKQQQILAEEEKKQKTQIVCCVLILAFFCIFVAMMG